MCFFLFSFTGGMLSIFLMGCYDEERDKWLTVTKVNQMINQVNLIRA